MAATERLLLRMEKKQKEKWEKAAALDSRSLSGWIKRQCDMAADAALKEGE